MHWMSVPCLTVAMVALLGGFHGAGAGTEPRDYTRLLEWIQVQDRQKPLLPLAEFQSEYDSQSHHANLQFFRENPELLEEIRRKLDSPRLRWQLDRLEHRLTFVPEQREEYAALYERYCRELVEFVLEKTLLENPFLTIQTLKEEKPPLPEDGVAVFLVHNLVKEYVATYSFHGPSDKTIRVDLNGTVSVGQVGTYTSTMNVGDGGTVKFQKNPYTIWQNSAVNPYTALMVPAEETLHAALRGYTEQAISDALANSPMEDPEFARRTVAEWVKVEEALVGGAVNLLLVEFLDDALPDLNPDWIEADLAAKNSFERYAFLKKGIELVKAMGYLTAIRMYAHSPNAFVGYLHRH